MAEQKESRIEEGPLMPDHVHRMIAIPPKYAVSQVVGFIKGKSAIHLARTYGERKRNFVGQHFGHEDFMCPRWAEMKKSLGSTFGGKRKRTSAWIKWGFGKRPPHGGPRTTGPR